LQQKGQPDVKKLLMIGYGVQERWVKEAVEKHGFECITTDRDESRNPDIVVDGTDVGVISWLASMAGGVEGVFTFTELVDTVARVAKILDVPGVSPLSAKRSRNKWLAYEYFSKYWVNTPETRPLSDDWLCKPIIGDGGRGVISLDGMMMQERIDGTHHDVNGLIHEGEFIPQWIHDRSFRQTDSACLETEMRVPTSLTEDQQKKLYQLLEDGVRALGIDWGPVKGDAVFDGKDFYLLEVAPRLHGPRSTVMAVPATGFDPMLPAAHVIAGQDPVGYEAKFDYCVVGRTEDTRRECFASYELGNGEYFNVWRGDSWEELHEA